MSCFYGGDAHHYQNTIQKLETRIKELEANNRLLHQSNVQLRKLDEQRAKKCMELELLNKALMKQAEDDQLEIRGLEEEVDNLHYDLINERQGQ